MRCPDRNPAICCSRHVVWDTVCPREKVLVGLNEERRRIKVRQVIGWGDKEGESEGRGECLQIAATPSDRRIWEKAVGRRDRRWMAMAVEFSQREIEEVG